MTKNTSISVQVDTTGALRAAVELEKVLRFVRLSAEVPRLTDREWRTLRDTEDRRRGA